MTRCQGLCQGLRRLFDFKGSLLQAIQRSSIVAHFYSLVKGFVNGLCYKPSNLSQLKGWQLRLDTSDRWLAHENSILWASQGYNWSTGSSGSDYWCGCAVPRSCGVNYNRSMLTIHIKVFVIAMLLFLQPLQSNKWLVFLFVFLSSLGGFHQSSPWFSLLIFSSSLVDFFTNWTYMVSSSVFH